MGPHADHAHWGHSDAIDTEINERVRSAARDNDLSALQDALAAGGSPEPESDESHPSATEYAVSHGNYAMLRLLIEAGAHLAQPDDDGGLLIEYAAWGGHVEILEYLLSDTCRLPADYTKIYRQFDMGKQSHPLDFRTPLSIACMDPKGRLPGIWGIVDRRLECAQILVTDGADVNFTHRLIRMRTPRHLATGWSLELAQFLVDHGASVTSQDALGAVITGSYATEDGSTKYI